MLNNVMTTRTNPIQFSMTGWLLLCRQDDLNQTLQMVRSDLQKALSERSILAVGRLHQTLSQFLDMESSFGSMMHFPTEFIRAVQSFIAAKIRSSPQEPLMEKLTGLVSVCMYVCAVHVC